MYHGPYHVVRSDVHLIFDSWSANSCNFLAVRSMFFFIIANDCFEIFFNLKIILNVENNDSNYRNMAR